jgi:rod shape-determining protein MreB
MHVFTSHIGIDLGTANTVFVSKNQQIILDEPSVVAFSVKNGRKALIGVGHDAKLMLGKTPGSIEAACPLIDGVIANFDYAEAMIAAFFKKAVVTNTFFKPKVIVCVPYGATPVEKRAIQQSFIKAGARRVGLLSEPMAAALGANLPWYDPRGSMVVDIGGGTTEIAVISLGGIVCASSLRIGGSHFEKAIIDTVRKICDLNIGNMAAERIKHNVNIDINSCVVDEKAEMHFTLAGIGSKDGVPKTANVAAKNFLAPINFLLNQIEQEVRLVLEKTPPDLAADIYMNGIMLTGGGVLLKGLDAELSRRLSIRCTIAENPKYCVAYGAGIAAKLEQRLAHAIEYEI